jgi:nicotinate-nucleotide adenylyltransferase
MAVEVLQDLVLQEVRLIPNARPPHRDTPGISAARRLALVRAAISGEPGLCVDDRELHRDAPSYTVDTLKSLRAELGGQPLCLIVGMDSFKGFPEWHRWQELFQLSHIVVLERPGYAPQLEPALADEVKKRAVARPEQLTDSAAGSIFFKSVSQLNISSTAIRQMIRAGKSIRYIVPDPVIEIIQQEHLYQD